MELILKYAITIFFKFYIQINRINVSLKTITSVGIIILFYFKQYIKKPINAIRFFFNLDTHETWMNFNEMFILSIKSDSWKYQH